MASADVRPALLLGLAAGMRTFAPPAAMVAAGRIRGRAAAAVAVLAAGELVADQLPQMRSRLEPAGLGGRAITAGLSGRAVAGPAGGVVGTLVAVAGAHAFARVRAALAARTGSDRPWAFAEDALAYGLVAVVARAQRV